MANEPDTTTIQNVYAERFAADLETNRKEQDAVSSQISELQDRLKQLKTDEGWLSGMQSGLPPKAEGKAVAAGGQESAEPAPTAGAGTVPQPRRGRKAPQAKKAAGAPASGTNAKAAVRKPAVKTARKTPVADAGASAKASTDASANAKVSVGEPPLRELVLALLVGASEPRMVSEVATELAQAHPGRTASTQVVRNTLENLTKKGAIEKEHKQGSVMYTAPLAAAERPASAVAATPGTAPAEEKAAEA
ncbi:hypothetical protein [Streptomyces sp. NPDC051183]|uniref:hypothetical protein n=1 Tax=Streptomyces sp. NPDC051183 TaxID=3155165 RepID=UPI003416EB1F